MLDLLVEGLELAVFGMTAVFILLGCLVFAVGGMSRLVRSFQPAIASVPAGRGDEDELDEDELTVAVAAAVHAYRRRGG
jgi:sodium pump decarboxylase gamma subunit